MLTPEHEITISMKHQSYLKILDVNINDGETVTWAVIRKAYKNRALIVHPDKGGSEDTFKELNTAFQKLEHFIQHGTEFEFDGLAEMSSSVDGMLNELNAHFDRMNAHFDRNFSEIHSGLDQLKTSVSELHASTLKLEVALDSLSDSVDKMAASTKKLRASIRAIDNQFDIDTPFYLGCYTVFLGSVVFALSGKHQPQNARSVGTFVFSTGLIATGGYLIANSLFKKNKPTAAGEDNEQPTALKLVNGTTN